MSAETVVLKFGSSVLGSPGDIPSAVHEIYAWYRSGHRVVAVVSAIGRTTNELIAEAGELAAAPEPYALAELLATGERKSAALLGIALDRAGIPARVVDPREIHLIAQGKPLDSEPALVGQSKIQELLASTPVLVVPGFFGHDGEGRLHLLGRGGSDLSAAFLASATHAKRCRLLKDVDGVYDRDPALDAGRPAQRFARLGYETAIRVASPLVQPKAVRFIERLGHSIEVAALGQGDGTVVGPHDDRLDSPPDGAPASVLILGLGTVGRGVYERLQRLPTRFRVIGALCRDPDRHAREGLPRGLLLGPGTILERFSPDAVVDALPGLEPSRGIACRFLERGVSVVSANKRLAADAASILEAAAARSGAALRYSAAVGGSAPMIETVRRLAHHGAIRSIEGILNGTCNYLLDRCAAGSPFAEALAEAQSSGFAESNPEDDLIGADAARKLRILARLAFGRELVAIDMRPLSAASLARARRELRTGQVLRVVSRAWQDGARLLGEVSLRALDASHPLAPVAGEWNRLVVSPAQGPDIAVSGRGAGRWPTAEAVIADLLELRRRKTYAPPQAAPMPGARREESLRC
jgi:homoserine dehydrogenase